MSLITKIYCRWKISRMAHRRKESFLRETPSAFNFLIEDYGFVPQKTRICYIVEYRSNNVAFRIYFDPRCSEMGVSIELIDSQRSNTYGLEVILEASLGQDHGIEIGIPLTTPEGVKHFVQRLAELVKEYCGPYLQGDTSSFDLLESVEMQMAHRGMELYQKRVRERAELAYQQEDYGIAIRLYENIQPYLRESDLEKLKSARRKQASESSNEV